MYIEREELLGAIKACKRMMNTDFPKHNMTQKDMMRIIEEFPAAEVTPVVRGEWIDDPRPYYGARQYVCDQCSEDEYWRTRFCCFKENFCPNCGARMDGGSDG